MQLHASYVQERGDDAAKGLKKCFDRYITPLFAFVARECSPKMSSSEIGLVASLTTLLSALLTTITLSDLPTSAAAMCLERLFLFSLIWSIAGVLEQQDRVKVDKHLRKVSGNRL